jgi:hypothetical protein
LNFSLSSTCPRLGKGEGWGEVLKNKIIKNEYRKIKKTREIIKTIGK